MNFLEELSNKPQECRKKGALPVLSCPVSLSPYFPDSNEGEKAVTVPLAPLPFPRRVLRPPRARPRSEAAIEIK